MYKHHAAEAKQDILGRHGAAKLARVDAWRCLEVAR